MLKSENQKKKKLKIFLYEECSKNLSLLSLNIISFTPTTTPPKKIIIPQIFLFLLFWKELYSSHFTTLHNEWRILPYPTTQIQMHLNVAHSGWWKDKIEMKKKNIFRNAYKKVMSTFFLLNFIEVLKLQRQKMIFCWWRYKMAFLKDEKIKGKITLFFFLMLYLSLSLPPILFFFC